jgi:hypothetical protein
VIWAASAGNNNRYLDRFGKYAVGSGATAQANCLVLWAVSRGRQ